MDEVDVAAWQQELPEKVRAWEEAKNADSAEKFWQQMENMRSHLGQSLRIPGPEAGEEDWQKFNKKLVEKVPTLMPSPNTEDPEQMQAVLRQLGAPESAAGYNLELPEQHQGLLELAHKHNLTRKQIGIIEELVGIDTAQREAASGDVKASQEALKSEWGAAHDERMQEVQSLLKSTDAPEAIIAMAQNGELRGDIAKWIYTVSQAASVPEGSQVSTQGRTKTVAVTPMEARQRISEIRNNPAFMDASHPDHQHLVAQQLHYMYYANGRTPPSV